MRNISRITGKAFILFLAFFTLSLAPINGSAATHRLGGDAMTADCGVTEAQVIEYLSDYGFMVVRIAPIAGCCDVMAYTTNPDKKVRVFISNNCIIGHEDQGQ